MVGRGSSNEQSPPRSRAYRRVHTDRSDPFTEKETEMQRRSRRVAVIGPIETWYLGKSRKSPVQQTQSITVYLQKWGYDVAA